MNKMRIAKQISCMAGMILMASTEAKVLTKQMVIKQVKTHFPEILIQHEKIHQAYQKITSARGEFDPAIKGQFNSTPTGGYQNNYYKGSLIQPIENTGNVFTAGYRIGRGDWPIYYQDYLTNSYGDTFVGLNIPLLRDRLIDKTRQNILNKLILAKSEELLLSIKKNEVIAKAIQCYYEWLKYSYRLKVANNLLTIAKARQSAISKQVAVGDIGQINLIENKRLIMQRKSVLTTEQQKYISAKNKLQFYIGNTINLNTKGAWQPPQLTRKLAKYSEHDLNFNSIKKKQPYLKYLETNIEKSKIAIMQAKNEMKPSLNLNVLLDKQHGKGNNKLSETSLNIGLKYQLPLRLRKAQGQVAEHQSIIREYRFQQLLFTRKLKLTFSNIKNDIKAFSQMYYLRSQEVKYATQLERAERQKFSAGDSSLFLVNQREQTVALTNFLVIDAFIQYKQRINLLRSLCFYKKKC